MLHHSVECKNQEVRSVQTRPGALCKMGIFYHFADTIGRPDTFESEA